MNVVVIRDQGGNVFGGFLSEPWKAKYPKFYGGGKRERRHDREER